MTGVDEPATEEHALTAQPAPRLAFLPSYIDMLKRVSCQVEMSLNLGHGVPHTMPQSWASN